MDEVVISDGANKLRIHTVDKPWVDGYVFWRFAATVTSTGLSATAGVVDGRAPGQPMSLVEFFDRLASQWQGWEGTKSWSALEGQLRLEASYHGFGRVHLDVDLTNGAIPDGWVTTQRIIVDPGEQMTQVSRGLRRLFESPVGSA